LKEVAKEEEIAAQSQASEEVEQIFRENYQ